MPLNYSCPQCSKTKILSLNSVICYQADFGSFMTFVDPGNMLQWLTDQLSELEKINGTAIIIAHVPNLDECLTQYGDRYRAILDRFQTVVRFSVHAHTHKEQFQVVSDVKEGKTIGMNYIVSSGTTY